MMNDSLAQKKENAFVTRLSAPGKLEIVRRPPAMNMAKMKGRGKIQSLPSYDPNSEKIWQVDVRSCDLSALDLRSRLRDLLQADFDTSTVWSQKMPTEFDPARIMELGKNPGLGLRQIHEKGITGTGIGVAIIDQALLVDHIEYKDRLRLYEEVHWFENAGASMHGAAVASIAVGKTVGVAPQAELYYIAQANVKETGANKKYDMDLTSIAQSIDRIVEINKTLPKERRIRVISISLGIVPAIAGYELASKAIQKAEGAGIYVIHVESEQFIGLGREPMADPDTFGSFIPGQFWASNWENCKDSLMAPMDSRCVAAPNGENDFVFTRTGGMSWAVPWVAGLYALACQVKPEITPKEFWEKARQTSVKGRFRKDDIENEFGNIINPKALLESLK